MPKQVFHGGQQPQDEWQQDLHRDNQGATAGQPGQPMGEGTINPDGLKAIHQQLPGLSDGELRSFTIISEGVHLKQGAKYFDLKHPGRGEFVATAGMSAGQDNWYIAKHDLDYLLWNRLTGVTDPARLDLADETEQPRPLAE